MTTLIPSPSTGWNSLEKPRVTLTGFREYDSRWRYPEDINLAGLFKVGKSLGTQAQRLNKGKRIIVGNDFRSYSIEVKNALALGLISAGMKVVDIGTVISPMAYFARIRLGIPCVAMVTASHNPNGWTGIKAGFQHPFTQSPEEMSQLRDIVREGTEQSNEGGSYQTYSGIAKDYLDRLCHRYQFQRKLKIVCATGNGTASKFAPVMLERMGLDVVQLHTELDSTFPHYNPNPESMVMLDDMKHQVKSTQADLAIGLDGDGDRLGVVDDECEEIFSDKLGLIFARTLAQARSGSRFVVDVKSTGAYIRDPLLEKAGAHVEYWKTGHSYMRSRTHESGAILGIEKSGHFYFAPPVGDGFDCGLLATLQLLRILDLNPTQTLSDLKKELPRTWLSPTMSPSCADEVKYKVVDRISTRFAQIFDHGGKVLGQRIADTLTVNGMRLTLEDGSWILVRASSNTPNLVVVCESMRSKRHLHELHGFIRQQLDSEPEIGAFDQEL